MLAQSRADGRRRIGLPRRNLQFDLGDNFFGHLLAPELSAFSKKPFS
jgi:hypothetical protein